MSTMASCAKANQRTSSRSSRTSSMPTSSTLTLLTASSTCLQVSMTQRRSARSSAASSSVSSKKKHANLQAASTSSARALSIPTSWRAAQRQLRWSRATTTWADCPKTYSSSLSNLSSNSSKTRCAHAAWSSDSHTRWYTVSHSQAQASVSAALEPSHATVLKLSVRATLSSARSLPRLASTRRFGSTSPSCQTSRA